MWIVEWYSRVYHRKKFKWKMMHEITNTLGMCLVEEMSWDGIILFWSHLRLDKIRWFQKRILLQYLELSHLPKVFLDYYKDYYNKISILIRIILNHIKTTTMKIASSGTKNSVGYGFKFQFEFFWRVGR